MFTTIMHLNIEDKLFIILFVVPIGLWLLFAIPIGIRQLENQS
jgi:hypothetical protein